eukprot:11194529-Lingulodinium_polyedra.AAC.1
MVCAVLAPGVVKRACATYCVSVRGFALCVPPRCPQNSRICKSARPLQPRASENPRFWARWR